MRALVSTTIPWFPYSAYTHDPYGDCTLTRIGGFRTPLEQLYYSIKMLKNNVKYGKVYDHFVWPAQG